MAPIRRYLRISKYSVLEVRVYLDNPALSHTWLLNPRNPILPRIIESVRPLVLPKLREEKERSRKRSTKKKGIKDVVVEDDFEVSIFLTETSTRHSLLTKHKHFHDTTQTKLTSNSGRLISATNEAPIDVDLAAELGGGPESGNSVAGLQIEESDDDDPFTGLAAIPAIDGQEVAAGSRSNSRPKRPRKNTHEEHDDESGIRDTEVTSGGESEESGNEEEEGLFVESDEDEISTMAPPPAKRRKEDGTTAEDPSEDKKKMAMDITYEGFSIYGRVLCLVVKRREGKPSSGTVAGAGGAGGKAKGGNGRGGSGAQAGKSGEASGQAMMETFIMSTQVPAGAEG